MSITAITSSLPAMQGQPACIKRGGPAFIVPDQAGQTGGSGITNSISAPLQASLLRAQVQHATPLPGAANTPNAADLPRAMRAYGAHRTG